MIEGWKETTLGEVAEIVKDQWLPGDADQKYIGLEHINQGDLQINGFGCSSSLQSNKFYFKQGDILFGKLRPYFRKVWKARFDGVCSTDIWVLRAKEGYDQNYLFYFMANPVFIDKSTGASIGTKMPRADWDFLKRSKWLFPPLSEQRAIAAVLSSFDDKIELLRRQNKTLEAIAQAIFKEWFVKFKVKGEQLKLNPKTGLPEGWKLGRIKDCGEIVCGKTPPKAINEYFGGSIPFIKIPDMHNEMFIVKTEDSLTEEGSDFQRNKFIPANSVCVSCIATVGLVSITSQKSQTNQQINTIIPNSDEYLEYLYFVLKNMTNDLIAIGSGGSATLNINTGVFSDIEIVLPSDDILKSYHSTVEPLFVKVLSNMIQIQTLSKLRDTLLPKLMKGEIRVKL